METKSDWGTNGLFAVARTKYTSQTASYDGSAGQRHTQGGQRLAKTRSDKPFQRQIKNRGRSKKKEKKKNTARVAAKKKKKIAETGHQTGA